MYAYLLTSRVTGQRSILIYCQLTPDLSLYSLIFINFQWDSRNLFAIFLFLFPFSISTSIGIPLYIGYHVWSDNVVAILFSMRAY